MRNLWLVLILVVPALLMGTPSCKQAQDEPEVSMEKEVPKEAKAPVMEKSEEISVPVEKQEVPVEEVVQEKGAPEIEETAESEIPVKGLKEKIIEEVKEKGEELEDKIAEEATIPKEGE